MKKIVYVLLTIILIIPINCFAYIGDTVSSSYNSYKPLELLYNEQIDYNGVGDTVKQDLHNLFSQYDYYFSRFNPSSTEVYLYFFNTDDLTISTINKISNITNSYYVALYTSNNKLFRYMVGGTSISFTQDQVIKESNFDLYNTAGTKLFTKNFNLGDTPTPSPTTSPTPTPTPSPTTSPTPTPTPSPTISPTSEDSIIIDTSQDIVGEIPEEFDFLNLFVSFLIGLVFILLIITPFILILKLLGVI